MTHYPKKKVGSKQVNAHRAIWFEQHGFWPDCDIDHIDGDKNNNKVENLRLATRSENMANRDKTSSNTSGYKGVFSNNNDTWFARVKSKRLGAEYLGNFKCKREAALVYNIAAERHFGSYAKFNSVFEDVGEDISLGRLEQEYGKI